MVKAFSRLSFIKRRFRSGNFTERVKSQKSDSKKDKDSQRWVINCLKLPSSLTQIIHWSLNRRQTVLFAKLNKLVDQDWNGNRVTLGVVRVFRTRSFLVGIKFQWQNILWTILRNIDEILMDKHIWGQVWRAT